MAKKRTPRKKAQGLGDTIESITEATGIKSVVTWLNGNEDCGECNERRTILNRLIPYRKPNPLNEFQYEYLTDIFKAYFREGRFYGSLKPSEKTTIVRVYNEVFNDRQSVGTCSRCYVRYLGDLKKVYDSYKVD